MHGRFFVQYLGLYSFSESMLRCMAAALKEGRRGVTSILRFPLFKKKFLGFESTVVYFSFPAAVFVFWIRGGFIFPAVLFFLPTFGQNRKNRKIDLIFMFLV